MLAPHPDYALRSMRRTHSDEMRSARQALVPWWDQIICVSSARCGPPAMKCEHLENHQCHGVAAVMSTHRPNRFYNHHDERAQSLATVNPAR